MLQLIDWPALAFNALWIAGAVLALSVVSIGQWESRVGGMRLRAWLGRPAAQVALAASAVLFCAGMLGTSGGVLERVLWEVLAAAFAVQACATAWSTRRHARAMPRSAEPAPKSAQGPAAAPSLSSQGRAGVGCDSLPSQGRAGERSPKPAQDQIAATKASFKNNMFISGELTHAA